MTAQEFNEKYWDNIEEGFYGLEFNIPPVTEYLDKYFEGIKHMDFTFSQIKLKFNMARVYTTLPHDMNRQMETEINALVHEWDKKH